MDYFFIKECKCCLSVDFEEVDGKLVCLCCNTTYYPEENDEISKEEVVYYNRVLEDKRLNHYDDALELIQDLIKRNPTNLEYYFQKILCLLGVEYVDDGEGKIKPTIRRLIDERISDLPEYKFLIHNADESFDRKFDTLNEIEAIRAKALRYSSREEPYDIFISFKQRTLDGNYLTNDYEDARSIYEKLSQDGYKVFFSPISLDNVAGTDYEPHIYNALKTSKLMLLVCSSPYEDYVNAPWVKNEWSRFLYYVNNTNDANQKRIIPVLNNGYSANKLPVKLGQKQCLKFNGDFFLSLNKILNKMFVKKEEKPTIELDEREVALKYAYVKCELEDFDEAKKLFNEFLAKYSDYRGIVGIICAITKNYTDYNVNILKYLSILQKYDVQDDNLSAYLTKKQQLIDEKKEKIRIAREETQKREEKLRQERLRKAQKEKEEFEERLRKIAEEKKRIKAEKKRKRFFKTLISIFAIVLLAPIVGIKIFVDVKSLPEYPDFNTNDYKSIVFLDKSTLEVGDVIKVGRLNAVVVDTNNTTYTSTESVVIQIQNLNVKSTYTTRYDSAYEYANSNISSYLKDLSSTLSTYLKNAKMVTSSSGRVNDEYNGKFFIPTLEEYGYTDSNSVTGVFKPFKYYADGDKFGLRQYNSIWTRSAIFDTRNKAYYISYGNYGSEFASYSFNIQPCFVI